MAAAACREERDQVERDAKNKEWAAQEAERAGEWYYKEVRQRQSSIASLLSWRPASPRVLDASQP